MERNPLTFKWKNEINCGVKILRYSKDMSDGLNQMRIPAFKVDTSTRPNYIKPIIIMF